MIILIRWDKKYWRHIITAVVLALLLALSAPWWSGTRSPEEVAVWQWHEDEIPSGNPLRVQAPLYEVPEEMSQLVMKLQDFYLED